MVQDPDAPAPPPASRGASRLPKTTLFGPKGRVNVNTADVSEWIKKGYTYSPDEKGEVVPDPEPAMTQSDRPNFAEFTVAQLQVFCSMAGIEPEQGWKKSNYVQALTASDFVPDEEE